MFKRILASIVIAFFIIGCGSPRIDTSSDEKMKASIEEIKKSLSDEKRKDFEDALKVVYFSKVNFDLKSIMALGAEGTAEKIKEEGKALISNKTADEVISEAKKIKEKIFEEEKKKALEEIQKLASEAIKNFDSILPDLTTAEKRIVDAQKFGIADSVINQIFDNSNNNLNEAEQAQFIELLDKVLKAAPKREKNKIGRLTEVYPSLFIVEYQDFSSQAGAINNSYVESYTYSDILTEKTLIRYLSPEEQAEIENK